VKTLSYSAESGFQKFGISQKAGLAWAIDPFLFSRADAANEGL